MAKTKKISLTVKLLVISCGSVAVVTAFVAFSFMNSLQRQREKVVQNFNNHSEALANSIKAQFYERYGDVQAFGNKRSGRAHVRV